MNSLQKWYGMAVKDQEVANRGGIVGRHRRFFKRLRALMRQSRRRTKQRVNPYKEVVMKIMQVSMDYWNDFYPNRGKEFAEGAKAAIRLYAWWKDGTQYVGKPRKHVTGKTLKQAIGEVDRAYGVPDEKEKSA